MAVETNTTRSTPIPIEDYKRYGRQMILDGFGLQGQVSLAKASVAVVGAGGLGCASLPYLASAGVGRIGIFDHDIVEITNLQRQILHNEETVGTPKAQSAKKALQRINSKTQIDAIDTAITSQNALSLLKNYDIILDCTDNVPTRYLLSDAAVVLNKPLVSGAAQKFDGQLSVYNLGQNGPCYRCIFPIPPRPANVGSCEELGVLGPVVGTIGNLQAVETIKILSGLHDQKPTMLIYNALACPPFRSIKLRSRREACPACGTNIDPDKRLDINNTDYVQFCGGSTPDWEKQGLEQGKSGERITVNDLQNIMTSGRQVEILDVRPATEFGICSLPGSQHVPLKQILEKPEQYVSSPKETIIVCRLGNDSQLAADALRRARPQGTITDLVGGLRAWSHLDKTFPDY
ncbi:molybdenum cofactor synthesis 3 [Coprinopsis marcescibilis]|uniref:Molybdenum cofactor synthesis 3 n=1 Tax=Coprinopsis marcescibilis TaxID=230819 RepID=A0A5C3KHR8_COPMA|nr:molybdenum cofactor synthesis 3 [Coprinopsis marcescibilis]